jgi:hypothetical protein
MLLMYNNDVVFSGHTLRTFTEEPGVPCRKRMEARQALLG